MVNAALEQKSRHLILMLLFAVAFFVLPSTTSAAITKTANNLGLVGYWSFDDATGTKATDFSGRGNTGTLTNMEVGDWSSGKRGGALNFDGVDEKVDLGSGSVAFNFSGDLSGGAWIKTTTTNKIILQYQDGTPLIYLSVGPTTAGGTANSFVVYLRTDSGSVATFSTTALVADGVWHHVFMTRSVSAQEVKLYVDGSLDSTHTYTDTGAITTAAGVEHNISHDNSTYAFNGSIDEVRVYSRRLTPVEVAAVYAAGVIKRRTPPELGLVSYWSFNDATGTLATDFSGRGNHGVLTNMESTDWVVGRRDKALVFDGTNEYVKITSPSLPLGSSARTMAGWVKLGVAGSYGEIMGYGQGDCTGKQFGLGSRSGNLSFWGGCADFESSLVLPVGQWAFIAAVYDGSTVTLYRNSSSQSQAVGTLATPTSHFFLGGETTDNGSSFRTFFNGSLDDVRIYDRALNAAEIAALYTITSMKVNTSQNNQLTSGLVGLWSFNGPDVAGTAVYDSSGQGGHGVLTSGPTVDIGKVGQGIRFDGSNDRIVIPHSSSLAGGTGSKTFALWTYIDSFPDGESVTLLSKMYSLVSSEISYSMFIATDGTFYFQTTNGANYRLYTASTTGVASGGWYHIVFEYTWGTAASAQLYVNGVAKSGSWTVGTGNDTFVDQSVSVEIGRLNHSNTLYEHWYKGVIDELRIYNRLLSAAEVLRLYKLGR